MFIARCPGCDGTLVYDHGAAVTAVCPQCRTAAERDGSRVRRLGNFPELPSAHLLGEEGRWRGRAFRVRGGVRKGMGAHVWTEWFLAFDDGGAGWLVEGDALPRIFPDPPEEVEVDGPVRVGTKVGAYRVRRAGMAKALAADGLFPYVLETAPSSHVELVGPEERPATLDDSGSPAALFEGFHVSLPAIGLAPPEPPPEAVAVVPVARPPGPVQQRVVARPSVSAPRITTICASCGSNSPGNPCASCGKDPRAAGQWDLLAPLGSGVNGATWRALDVRGKPVALKEIRVPPSADEEAHRLALREVDVLRQLRHPGIPRYEGHAATGTAGRRTLWLAMELVQGVSLATEMERRRYTPDEAFAIVEELAGILTYLHGLSPPVVHRDVKPQNVLRRDNNQRLVLIDFGSVRDRLTDGGTVAGTFGYMAPEQYAGDAVPASDWYALGATAVHLLTRAEPRSLADHQGRIRWRERVGTDLPWLAGLLEADPARRIRTLEGLRSPPSQPVTTPPPPKKRFWPFT